MLVFFCTISYNKRKSVYVSKLSDFLDKGDNMKKKIALFAGGWSSEYVENVVRGASEIAQKENADLFVFINFSLRWDSPEQNEKEFNIFTLPDLNDFDGIILMANSFNLTMEVEFFKEKLKDVKVPVVSLEYEMGEVPSVYTDNYSGMYELCRHIIEHHGVRDILFIGGPQDHMESAERLRALQEAAKESGFIIPEENIKYGDWSMGPAMNFLREWLEEKKKLPEAVICANDIMAMGAGQWLVDQGFVIPQDVIITGYDCLRQGEEFIPRLATVSHEWGGMGKTAMDMIIRMIQGEKIDSLMLNSRFVKNESCGCGDYDVSKQRQGWIRAGNMMNSVVFDAHFRSVYLYIRNADNAIDLSRSLSTLFEKEHDIEGDNFALCLDPEFFRFEEGDGNLRVHGYGDKMAVVGAIMDGKTQPYMTVDTKDAIFGMAKKRKETGVYIYVPIYGDSKNYGFGVLTGDINSILDNHIYIWTRHLNQYLEHVRRNITIEDLTRRLTQMSVTDELTGIYNRAGCERIAYPLLKEWKETGGTGVIMLVDIDKMKLINDYYGHANGDLALRTVAAVLKAEVPEDWVVSRIGGDEFFLWGRVVDKDTDLNALRKNLERKLVKEVEKREIKFPLMISVGSVKVRPEDTVEIEKYMQMADEDMYRIKNAHHRKMEQIIFNGEAYGK